jgi:hypothetical protein
MKKVFVSIAVVSLSLAAASAQAMVRAGLNDPGRTNSSNVEKIVPKRSKDTGRRGSSRVLRLGPSATYLRNGLSLNEVVRLLGKPTSISERRDGELRLTTCMFPRSEGRILVAEFENGVLTGSRTEIREDDVAQQRAMP